MSIIIVRPVGVFYPSRNVLDYCFRHNPHGAGIMVADRNEKRLIIRKGLMSSDEVLDTFWYLKERHPSCPFIFHFRLATDGGISPGLCHPFPIDNRKQVLLARQPSNVKIAVAHNGVIPKWTGLDEDLSDTFLYVKNDLFPAKKKNLNFLQKQENRERIANETNSQLAFMNSRGHIYTIGQFYKFRGSFYTQPIPYYLQM